MALPTIVSAILRATRISVQCPLFTKLKIKLSVINHLLPGGTAPYDRFPEKHQGTIGIFIAIFGARGLV